MADYYNQYRLFRLVFFLGLMLSSRYTVIPAVDFVAGLPVFRAAPESAEQWLNAPHKDGRVRYECREGELGWDYICTEFQTGPRGELKQFRRGVVDRVFTKRVMSLPNDGPIPTRAARLAQNGR